MFLILTLTSYSQDLKTKAVPISTLKNINRQIEKCDSLRVRYFEALKELTRLQDEIEQSTNTISQLDQEKKSLKDEIDTIKIDFKAVEKKQFNLSIQFGAQPLFIENDFSVRPYFGIGVGYTIFRF